MSDSTIINGESYDDRTVEVEDKGGNDSKVPALMQKIAALEQEKTELVHENEVINQRMKKLKGEIEASDTEKEKLKSDTKALDSIAARAAELETEVCRLQHDLISSANEAEEVNAELVETKRAVAELRESDLNKGLKLEAIEKEWNLLLEKITKDSEGVKESNSRISDLNKGLKLEAIEKEWNLLLEKITKDSEGVKESNSRISDLEKKIEALELRDSSYKSEKVRVEEEMRVKIEEREGHIRNLQNLVEELQAVMEKSNKEREELEIVKNELEALLKKSERKVKEMENKMGLLHKELEGSEKMISGLKEKASEDINGKDVGLERGIDDDEEKGLMGLNLEWPVVAVSASTIALVAAGYLCYLRQR